MVTTVHIALIIVGVLIGWIGAKGWIRARKWKVEAMLRKYQVENALDRVRARDHTIAHNRMLISGLMGTIKEYEDLLAIPVVLKSVGGLTPLDEATPVSYLPKCEICKDFGTYQVGGISYFCKCENGVIAKETTPGIVE